MKTSTIADKIIRTRFAGSVTSHFGQVPQRRPRPDDAGGSQALVVAVKDGELAGRQRPHRLIHQNHESNLCLFFRKTTRLSGRNRNFVKRREGEFGAQKRIFEMILSHWDEAAGMRDAAVVVLKPEAEGRIAVRQRIRIAGYPIGRLHFHAVGVQGRVVGTWRKTRNSIDYENKSVDPPK